MNHQGVRFQSFFVTAALIVSLSIAEVDTILSLLRFPTFSSVDCNWFLPLAVLTVVFFISASILFFCISWFSKFLNLDSRIAVLATALFLLFFFVPALLNDLLHVRQSVLQLILLFSVFVMALVAAAAAYLALNTFRSQTLRLDESESSLAVIPLLLAEILILIRVRQVFHLHFNTALIAGFFFILCFTIWLFRRKSKSGNFSIASLICLSILIVGSALFPRFAKAREDHKASSSHQIKRVILITIDTLRADALSCYSKRSTGTPNIDTLATDSVQFREAISPAPWTLPALTSIMTGVNPLVHSTIKFNSQIPRNIPLLAEHLKKAGYQTGAIGKNVFITHDFTRGFAQHHFYLRPVPEGLGASLVRYLWKGWCRGDVSSTEITGLAERWIEEHKVDDFFLWVHYLDPHLPYSPPKSYLAPDVPGSRIGTKCSVDLRDRIRRGLFVPSLAERKRIESLYRSEVRYVDEAVGRLIRTLKEKKLYDDSLILLTSDHGEEFWEHEDFEHGHTIYNELLHVPLLIKLPSRDRKEILSRVTTASITPTILDLCRIPYSPNSFSSQSVVPLWSKNDAPSGAQSPIVSTGLLYHEDRIAVIFDHYKYVRYLLTGREEIFDLSTDPAEMNSLSLQPLLDEGRRQLADQQKMALLLQTHYGITAQQRGIDTNTLEMLKSLGYLTQ